MARVGDSYTPVTLGIIASLAMICLSVVVVFLSLHGSKEPIVMIGRPHDKTEFAFTQIGNPERHDRPVRTTNNESSPIRENGLP